MGSLSSFIGQRLYLDANVFIYYLEAFPAFVTILDELFGRLDNGTVLAVTSELTLAEVLVKPLQAGNAASVAQYEQFLSDSGSLSMVPVTRELLVSAARLRAETSMKLPDAIHVATAVASGCVACLTNDQRLRAGASLPIVRLSEL